MCNKSHPKDGGHDDSPPKEKLVFRRYPKDIRTMPLMFRDAKLDDAFAKEQVYSYNVFRLVASSCSILALLGFAIHE